jgi:hypothetical protein
VGSELNQLGRLEKKIEKPIYPPESVGLQAIIHLTSAMLATSQRRHTVKVFQVYRGPFFRVEATLPAGQYCCKAEMDIRYRGAVLCSCTSQGFGDPVRRNRTPSLNESGRFLRNARRDCRRARRSLLTDITGGMIAKRDIIYEKS